MKQEIELKNGGKIIITEEGSSFISRMGVEVNLSWEDCYNRIMCNNSDLKNFCLIGKKEREKIKNWYSKWCKTKRTRSYLQDYFRNILGEALKSVDYNYMIAVVDPLNCVGDKMKSLNRRLLSSADWEREALVFAPEYNSDIATLYELFMWYAYRISNGEFTIAYVCDNDLRGRCREEKRSAKIVRTEKGSKFAVCNEMYSIINYTDVISAEVNRFANTVGVFVLKGERIRDI